MLKNINDTNNTEEWGWFIDTDIESLKETVQIINQNIKNKIIEDDEYNYYINNNNIICENDDLYDLEPICYPRQNNNFLKCKNYLVEFYSLTIMTSVFTYVFLCIL